MAEDWSEEPGLRWRVCSPFGVEVDADLSALLSDAACARLVGLFRDHGLIIAHSQSLTRERHEALMALFGPIVAHREGDPGYMRSEGGEGPGTSKLSWHSDTAYTETPFEALSLHALSVIDGKSSTRFVHAEQALDRLPNDLRNILESHDADMMSAGVEKIAVRLCDIRDHPSPGYRNRLPALRTNRRTGRSYVAVSEMQTAALFDMVWEDSRAALDAVFSHLYAPSAVYEHVWHNGDLVVWDNLACQHSRGWLNAAGLRLLQRVIVGPKSFAVRQGKA